jgi:hypothetical protein
LGPLPVAKAFGIREFITAILGFGRLFLATILSTKLCNSGNCSLVTTLAPALHITILSEKYHCAIIIINAIIVIGKNPRPIYARTLRNTIYSKPRIAKLKTIRATSPESLFCQDGFAGLGN